MIANHVCDAVIIGNGLGACAIAKKLEPTGASIIMLTGAGKSRSTDIDGGLVSTAVVANAFGTTKHAPLHQVGEHVVFRRDRMETWAREQLADNVIQVTDFEEKSVLPHDSSELTVLSTKGESIRTKLVLLTEGANPKIGIAARLRPDFAPADMVHYGRAHVSDVTDTSYRDGQWRTSWGMPVRYQVVPQPGGAAIVTVSARIENVMRSGRNAKEALSDFLQSDQATELGVDGEHGPLAMELVPLRTTLRGHRVASHNLLIAPDATGVIDAGDVDRWNATIASCTEMGAMIAREWPTLLDWEELGSTVCSVFLKERTPYHDDSTTGFIERGPGPTKGLFDRLFGRK